MRRVWFFLIFFVFMIQPLSVDSSYYSYQSVYYHDGFEVGDSISWKVTAFKIGNVDSYNETMLSGIKVGSNITLEIIKATDGVDLNSNSYKVEDYFALFVDGQAGVLGDNPYPSIEGKEYISSTSSQSYSIPLISPYRMVYANGTEITYREDLQNTIDAWGIGSIVDNGDNFTLNAFGTSVTIDEATYQLVNCNVPGIFGWFTFALEPLVSANNNSNNTNQSNGNKLDTFQFIPLISSIAIIALTKKYKRLGT